MNIEHITAHHINTFGLVIAMSGTVLVFFWGLARESISGGIEVEDGTMIDTKWGIITAGEARKKDENEKIRYMIISRCGLGMVFLGFLCQLIASYYPK